MITWMALKAINFYQKFISPYKGFNCAHRVATGETGCSGYGKKVIKRFGFFTGFKLLNRRFYDCSWHAKNLRKIKEEQEQYKIYRPVSGYKLQQGGFVDCDCGGCDMPNCDFPDVGDCVPDCKPGKLFSAFDCLDCVPDDCGDFNKKKHTEEFKEKREKRNQNKYDNSQEKNAEPLSLKKEETEDSDSSD